MRDVDYCLESANAAARVNACQIFGYAFGFGEIAVSFLDRAVQ